MSLTDLASLGSFVSAVAVLISLVYLSLQVKQAERNQQASIRATRVTRIAFDSLAASLKHSLAQPGMRAFYKRQRAMLGRDFSAFVDKLLVRAPVDSVAQWRADVAAELAGRQYWRVIVHVLACSSPIDLWEGTEHWPATKYSVSMIPIG